MNTTKPRMTAKDAAAAGYAPAAYAAAYASFHLLPEAFFKPGQPLPDGVGRSVSADAAQVASADLADGIDQDVEPQQHLIESNVVAAENSIADAKRELDQHLYEQIPHRPWWKVWGSAAPAGATYTLAEAVDQVRQDQAEISADEDQGDGHIHHRTPKWLHLVARFAPVAESFAFFFFLTALLNAPVLPGSPGFNFGVWMACLIGALILPSLQWRFVTAAGKAQSEHRWAKVRGLRVTAEERATVRNHNLLITACTTTFVLVLAFLGRVFFVSAGMGFIDTLIASSTLLVAAIGLPLVGFLAAIDGSRTSRRRDVLTSQLEESYSTWSDQVEAAQDVVDEAGHTGLHVAEATLPALVTRACEQMNVATAAAELLHLMAGRTDTIYNRKAPSIDQDAESAATGALGEVFRDSTMETTGKTGIEGLVITTDVPGSASVDTAPLVDAYQRLMYLAQRTHTARQAVAETRNVGHPWKAPSPEQQDPQLPPGRPVGVPQLPAA